MIETIPEDIGKILLFKNLSFETVRDLLSSLPNNEEIASFTSIPRLSLVLRGSRPGDLEKIHGCLYGLQYLSTGIFLAGNSGNAFMAIYLPNGYPPLEQIKSRFKDLDFVSVVDCQEYRN